MSKDKPESVSQPEKPSVSPLVADEPMDALRQGSSDKAAAKASSPAKSAMDETNNAKSGSASKKGSSGLGSIGWLALLLVLVLGGALWWQHDRFDAVTRTVGERLQTVDQRVAALEDQTQRALRLATSANEVQAQMDSRLKAIQSDLTAMEQTWQNANQGQGLDTRLLVNDLRRLITLANQQLTLLGNVNSAIAILESVQAMLEFHQVAQLQPLERAVALDLTRLKTVPQVDLPRLAAQIDSLIVLTSKAPLLVPDAVSPMLQMRDVQVQDAPSQETQTQTEPSSPSAQAVANQPSDQAWWQSLPDRATGWATAWFSDASRVVLSELGDLVSIRKASDPQALLLSEQQAMQLRANVRSMLLSAQLALMTRQSTIWRSELSEIEALLSTQYEPQSVDTKAALRLVRELLAKPVSVELPALTDSLSALEAAVRALSVPAAGAQ